MRDRQVAYHGDRGVPATAWAAARQLARDYVLCARSTPTLLVEQRRTSAELITDLLGRLGFSDIEMTTSAENALELLHQRKFGLVLADWDLEPMNGWQLLRAVRNDDRLRRTPFLMTAEHLSCDKAVLAKRTGVDALLLKPFRATALKTKLEQITNSRRMPWFGLNGPVH
jgi:two-component system chemotaxis response regulator CheY